MREIYEKLWMEYYSELVVIATNDKEIDYARRQATLYAVKNTVKEWIKQCS